MRVHSARAGTSLARSRLLMIYTELYTVAVHIVLNLLWLLFYAAYLLKCSRIAAVAVVAFRRSVLVFYFYGHVSSSSSLQIECEKTPFLGADKVNYPSSQPSYR